MFYKEKDKLGFKFYELEDLTNLEYEVNYLLPVEIDDIEKLKYVSNLITSTIEIELKDKDLKKDIERFLRKKLNVSNFEFKISKTYSISFNNKGRNSITKLNRYNKAVKELRDKILKEDTKKIFLELISLINSKVNEYNKKEEAQMIEHFSKFDTYQFESSEIKETNERIKILEEKLKTERKELAKLRLKEIEDNLKECKELDDKDKNKIIKNLRNKVENFVNRVFITR